MLPYPTTLSPPPPTQNSHQNPPIKNSPHTHSQPLPQMHLPPLLPPFLPLTLLTTRSPTPNTISISLSHPPLPPPPPLAQETLTHALISKPCRRDSVVVLGGCFSTAILERRIGNVLDEMTGGVDFVGSVAELWSWRWDVLALALAAPLASIFGAGEGIV